MRLYLSQVYRPGMMSHVFGWRTSQIVKPVQGTLPQWGSDRVLYLMTPNHLKAQLSAQTQVQGLIRAHQTSPGMLWCLTFLFPWSPPWVCPRSRNQKLSLPSNHIEKLFSVIYSTEAKMYPWSLLFDRCGGIFPSLCGFRGNSGRGRPRKVGHISHFIYCHKVTHVEGELIKLLLLLLFPHLIA